MSLSYLLYKNFCTHAPGIEVMLSKDLDQVGSFWAGEIIKAIQYFMKLSPVQPIAMHFCTGDTPWIGYRKLVDWIATWETEQTQSILRDYRIDPDIKPDMKRIIAFPLDAIFPQCRDAYYAFARMLNALFDQLEIQVANRHLFYGDLIVSDDGDIRQMTDVEFTTLMHDVEQNGLMIEEFKRHDLREGIQARHLQAMDYHARDMSIKCQELGGVHIFLWGIGPSYEGKGHVGFMEAGTPFDQRAFIGSSGYYINAGHAKENGGIANMYTQDGKAKYGFITFGFYELLYRGRNGDNEKIIGIATNNNKAASVEIFLQEALDTQYPLTGLQRSKGVLILDQGAAHRLRFITHPWEFALISQWAPSMVENFFLQLSQDCDKPIHKLNKSDSLRRGSPNLIADICDCNVCSLTVAEPWQALTARVSEKLAAKLVFPDHVSAKLRLVPTSKILCLNPHLDDEFLAMNSVIREFTRQGHRVCTYYLAKGHTAVHDSHILAILERVREFSDEELRACPDYRKIIEQLWQVCQQRSIAHQSASDFFPWRHIPSQEQRLRALSLYAQLREYFSAKNFDINTARLCAVVNFVTQICHDKLPWGCVDLDFVSRLKTWVRITEAITAMMSLGLKFEDIHPPIEVSWYTSYGRGLTARQSDIDKVKEIIAQEYPQVLISNGEGFPDYGAHSTTEISAYLALAELIEQGQLPTNMQYLQYAGVWERISARDVGLSVVLSCQDLEQFHHSFRNFYPSQAPAPVPDAGTREINFFSDQVCANARYSRQECIRFLGDRIPDVVRSRLLHPEAGVLNYKLLDVEDPQFLMMVREKQRELARVRTAKERSSNETFQGKAQKPPWQNWRNKLGDIPLDMILSQDEISW